MRTAFAPYLLVLLAAGVAAPGAARADGYAGSWTLTGLVMEVRLTSWGEHCGPKPRAYSSNKERPVEIIVQGRHLVFSQGGLRTDRCWSPNPRLQTVSESVSSARWVRDCETTADDSRYERGEYLLTAVTPDRLESRALSQFNWRLQGDHCQAEIEERRVYVRSTAAAATEQAPVAETAPAQDPAPEQETAPACPAEEPVKRLTLRPTQASIGPGERVCFVVEAERAGGCRGPVTAHWSAQQGGLPVAGLIGGNGCFTAGATAADAEGRYDLTARFGKSSASATVTVRFPVLGELIAARLPLGDGSAAPQSPEATAGEGRGSTAPPAPSPIAATLQQQAPATEGRWFLAIAVTAAALLLLAAATAAVWLILRNRRKAGLRDAEDWLDDPRVQRRRAPDTGRPPPGMICPRCHRGYDVGAAFCPHDAEKLVPYDTWRASRTSPSRSAPPRST